MTVLRGTCGVLSLLLAMTASVCDSMKCDRKLTDVTVPSSPVGDRFRIVMLDLNKTNYYRAYMPKTKYLVTLEGVKTDGSPVKFSRFLLSVDNYNENLESGIVELVDPLLTQFSEKCPNAVMETSQIPKNDVSVIWTSPPEGNGCLLIRATVMETPDSWYMDDGGLIVTMCEDSKAIADNQGPILQECCACDEAKYEVTFEGLWSRNTHPKDFPSKWLIRFSDVIGASHTVDYKFWSYHGMASEGLKQVAEHGSTRTLESELKAESEHIRTIVKARGISYPNVTSRTFAVFRVDRRHHLVSLVSMIDPSPDWIVGVSELELCLQNCSWIEYKELNLYPYDAGTDDGITYMSPDSPSDPQQPIRRITSSYPNDPRSPFYDETGQDMKPMAKLYLNRQRLYEKTCEDQPLDTTKSEACAMTEWSEWTSCSVTCGMGHRLKQKHFLNASAAAAYGCSDQNLTKRLSCFVNVARCNSGHSTGIRTGILESKDCELEPWSSWSTCTGGCPSVRTRSRNFRYKRYRKLCKAEPDAPVLEENEECDDANCYEEPEVDKTCPEHLYTAWSMWDPCSSTCGTGYKQRWRELISSDLPEDAITDPNLCRVQRVKCEADIPDCNITRQDIQEICSEPVVTGSCNDTHILRVYYDKNKRRCSRFWYRNCDRNRNNFATEEECYRVCGGYQRLRGNASTEPKNFKVFLSSVLSYHIPVQEQRSAKTKRAKSPEKSSEMLGNFKKFQTASQIIDGTEMHGSAKVICDTSEWGDWSPCAGCHGFSIRVREYVLSNRNTDRYCGRKLMQKKKCRKSPECLSRKNGGSRRRRYRDPYLITTLGNNEVSTDCEVTPWSQWSSCSATCGKSTKRRTRSIVTRPRGPRARWCPTLEEFKNCHKPACPEQQRMGCANRYATRCTGMRQPICNPLYWDAPTDMQPVVLGCANRYATRCTGVY